MRPQWTEWFNVCLMMLNISFWSKLITTILLVWRPDWIWQYKVKTMFLFDSQGITFTALSYIEVLGYSSWIRNKKFWTYRAMSQFWVSSQPPPSDISVPWIICDKQWTARKKRTVHRTVWTISLWVVVQFYPSLFIFLSHYHTCTLTFPNTKKN